MTLRETLEADIKAAMRSGDAVVRDTLRMVVASIKQAEMMDRMRSRAVPFRWLYDRRV